MAVGVVYFIRRKVGVLEGRSRCFLGFRISVRNLKKYHPLIYLIYHLNSETAFSFSTSYVRSLASTAPAGPAALELIASALSLPSVFDFDSILKLDAIQTQKAHPLFALLQIFNSQGLEEFTRWKGSNLTILDSFSAINLSV